MPSSNKAPERCVAVQTIPTDVEMLETFQILQPAVIERCIIEFVVAQDDPGQQWHLGEVDISELAVRQIKVLKLLHARVL
ncbi:MAG: hypothetical protein ACPIOQ_42935, partial [Promethearchaeia archaeon]